MPNSNDKQTHNTTQSDQKDKDRSQSQTGRHQLTQEEARRGGEHSQGQQGSSGGSGQHRAQESGSGSQHGGKK